MSQKLAEGLNRLLGQNHETITLTFVHKDDKTEKSVTLTKQQVGEIILYSMETRRLLQRWLEISDAMIAEAPRDEAFFTRWYKLHEDTLAAEEKAKR